MSASTPDNDECVCKVCRFTWGVSPEATVHETVEDLQARAGELSIAIFRHWILLNKTLKRYQDTIQKRWTKKNNTQRSSVLLTAWPSMAATHRPDFAQLRNISTKGCRGRINRTKEREANLFPYINREDLVHCPNLLMFLNSRGRHLPHKFAFGDRTSAHISVNTPSSTCDDINQRRMVLYGKRTPRSYGELSTFKVGDDTDMLGMHPITGLLVLEIQERILRFLVTCCRLILHDLDLNKIDSEPTQKPTSIVTASASAFRTVTALANEAPYRLPQRLDLARLCMLVEAKRSEVEEHLWSLREDPRYFALQLQEWAEHNGMMVPDKNGNRHVSVGKKSFWNRVCKSLIIHAYRSLVFFDEMFEQLVHLQKLMMIYKKNVHPTKRLPLRLEEEFQRLDKLVDEMRHGPLNDLALGFAASPPLRSDFERNCKDKMPSFHDLIVKPKSGSAWRIHVLFRTLLSEDQHDRHGLVNIVGEIQRTLDEGSVESQDITSWVSSRVSDLALIVEVKHQLELFQPWYTMWRHHSQPMLLDMGYEPIEFIDDTIYSTVDCVDLEADPARFVYPSEKRRTKATVTRMRESENALDSLWEVIDQHCNCHTGHVLSELLIDFFKERDRKIQRTPAWVESNKGSESRPVQQAEQEWISRSLPLQALDSNARCSRPGKAELLEGATRERTKVKTRSTCHRERIEQEGKLATTLAAVKPFKKITVNKRAYKVFSTLFHVPSANEQHKQGEVAWTEFVYAMLSVGFSPEKLYGSSWMFAPAGIDVKRSIQFHEPHPHPKMHFWEAKKTGRRLNRAYGWVGETFVCK